MPRPLKKHLTAKQQRRLAERKKLAAAYARGMREGENVGKQKGFIEGRAEERKNWVVRYGIPSDRYSREPLLLGQKPERPCIELYFERGGPVDLMDVHPMHFNLQVERVIFRAIRKSWQHGVTGQVVTWYDWQPDGC